MAGAIEQVKPKECDACDPTAISANELGDRLGDVMDQVFSGREEFEVTRYSRPRGYLIGPDAYADYQQLRRERTARRTGRKARTA